MHVPLHSFSFPSLLLSFHDRSSILNFENTNFETHNSLNDHRSDSVCRVNIEGRRKGRTFPSFLFFITLSPLSLIAVQLASFSIDSVGEREKLSVRRVEGNRKGNNDVTIP